MRNDLIAAAVVSLALLVAVAPAAAERIDREYHESFDVEPGAKLHLRHGDGDVTITPWQKDVVQIDVVYRAEVSGWGSGRRRDFEVEFEQSGDTIRVTGHEPSFGGVGFFNRRDLEYVYDVQAPAWVELRLIGDDGDVEIEGWRATIHGRLEDGDLELNDVVAERVDLDVEDGDLTLAGIEADLILRAEDGDLRLEDCRVGDAEIRTDDGDVWVERCSGSFGVTTEDGNQRLLDLSAGTLDLRTDDGDVELRLAEVRDLDLTIRAQDGTVDVSFPAGISADLEVATGDGRIRLDDVSGVELSRSRRRASARLGGGEGSIRITTDDGNVTLRERAPSKLEAAPGR